jgi:hypothetical protein
MVNILGWVMTLWQCLKVMEANKSLLMLGVTVAASLQVGLRSRATKLLG